MAVDELGSVGGWGLGAWQHLSNAREGGRALAVLHFTALVVPGFLVQAISKGYLLKMAG